MINKKIIDVTIPNLVSFCPCTVSFDFSSTGILNQDVQEIIYDFGDGEKRIVNNTIKINADGNFTTYALDKKYDKTYFFDDVYIKTFYYTITLKMFGGLSDIVYNGRIVLNLPTCKDIFSNSTNLKLVGSRFFGLDNQRIYLLESQQEPLQQLIPMMVEF